MSVDVHGVHIPGRQKLQRGGAAYFQVYHAKPYFGLFHDWNAAVYAQTSALGTKPAELKKKHDNMHGAKQAAARYKGVYRIVRGTSEYFQAERRGGTYIG